MTDMTVNVSYMSGRIQIIKSGSYLTINYRNLSKTHISNYMVNLLKNSPLIIGGVRYENIKEYNNYEENIFIKIEILDNFTLNNLSFEFPIKVNLKVNHNNYELINDIKLNKDISIDSFTENEKILTKWLNVKHNTYLLYYEYNYDSIINVFNNVDGINKIYNTTIKFCNKNKLDDNYIHLLISDLLFATTAPSIALGKKITEISRRNLLNFVTIREDFYMMNDYILLYKKYIICLKVSNIINYREVNLDIAKKEIFISLNMDLEIMFNINNYKNKYYILNIKNNYYTISSYRNYIKAYRKSNEVISNLPINFDALSNFLSVKIRFCGKLKNICNENLYIMEQNILNKYNINNINDYFKLKKYWEYDDYRTVVQLYLLNINIYNVGVYIPLYIDFRGRIYFDSIISPTNNKLLREFLVIETKNNDIESLFTSNYYKMISKYFNKIDKYGVESLKNKYAVIMLLIETGKILIEKSLSKYEYTTNEIIDLGLNAYENDLKNDSIYYTIKMYELRDLIENGNIGDIMIWRDATASGLQNFSTVFKLKEGKERYLNMSGDKWIDTYSYIIVTLCDVNELSGELEFVKNRKHFKKVIMTIPYNVTKMSAKKYFMEEIKVLDDYKKLSNAGKDKLNIVFDKFFEALKTKLLPHFFGDIKYDDFDKFIYVKSTNIRVKEYKINSDTERHKYGNFCSEQKIDNTKTLRANIANNLHKYDARMIHRISYRINCITIHDCYGTPLFSYHVINDDLNILYKVDNYSGHILL